MAVQLRMRKGRSGVIKRENVSVGMRLYIYKKPEWLKTAIFVGKILNPSVTEAIEGLIVGLSTFITAILIKGKQKNTELEGALVYIEQTDDFFSIILLWRYNNREIAIGSIRLEILMEAHRLGFPAFFLSASSLDAAVSNIDIPHCELGPVLIYEDYALQNLLEPDTDKGGSSISRKQSPQGYAPDDKEGQDIDSSRQRNKVASKNSRGKTGPTVEAGYESESEEELMRRIINKRLKTEIAAAVEAAVLKEKEGLAEDALGEDSSGEDSSPEDSLEEGLANDASGEDSSPEDSLEEGLANDALVEDTLVEDTLEKGEEPPVVKPKGRGKKITPPKGGDA